MVSLSTRMKVRLRCEVLGRAGVGYGGDVVAIDERGSDG